MKYFWAQIALVALPLSVSAFPALSEQATRALARVAFIPPKHEKRAIAFDAAAQLVDVTGAHAFVPPNFAAGDQRGPCPGLNALANHNYLPHNGVSSWVEIANQTTAVFGLGQDIAGFLAVYGAIFDGNIVSLNPGYSIGGATPLNQNILGGLGLLGTPQGLSGSHNKYESDASAARGDLYTSGNDYKLDINRFNALYALQNASAAPSYDLSVWNKHRANMFEKSKNENPYFFYAPFAGVIASTGGFTFPPRMFSNKSAAYPDNGILDKEILKSFFSITGSDDALVYTEGHEKIPANFYKRAVGNEYTGSLFFEDLLTFSSNFPSMLSIGGNTGTTNSYTALDLGNLTGGLYNSATLLEGNNLACFVFQSLLAAAPDVLKIGYSSPAGPLAALSQAVGGLVGGFGCQQLASWDQGAFAAYPGASCGKGGIL